MPVRPRIKKWASFAATAALIGLCSQTGCRSTPPVVINQTAIDTVMVTEQVPQDVRRLAVWYPRTFEQEMTYGYSRLEQATFQLKKQRSWIKIVERRDLD